jgi:hypothetical protein
MTLKELKIWIDQLPEEFLEFSVVHAEIIRTDEEEDEDEDGEESFSVRIDKPISALSVDEENGEILIMNDFDGNTEDLEFEID